MSSTFSGQDMTWNFLESTTTYVTCCVILEVNLRRTETLLSWRGASDLERYSDSALMSGIALRWLFVLMCCIQTSSVLKYTYHRLVSDQLRIRQPGIPLEIDAFARDRQCDTPGNVIRWIMQHSSIALWSNSDVSRPVSGIAKDDALSAKEHF